MTMERFHFVEAAVRVCRSEVLGTKFDFVIDVENVERPDGTKTQIIYVSAKCWRKDAITGEMGWGLGTKYLIPEFVDEEYIAKQCFVAVRNFAEHEVREGFLWNGKPVLGPHVPLRAVWDSIA